MNRVICVLIAGLMLLGSHNFQFDTVHAEDSLSRSFIMVSHIGMPGEFSFKTNATGDVQVFSSDFGEETLVWDSPVDPEKPADIDDVFISHDSQYIHVRIMLHRNIDDDFDPFVAISIDSDCDPETGMPKLSDRSYNMGGEEFFARFSTGYGYEKFILDTWDIGSGDTVETGGLGDCSFTGKEISFSIPRRAIGNPSILDFKVVGRVYQATNPDLSPNHLTYNLTSATQANGVSAVLKDGNCVIKTEPKDLPGLHQYHIKISEEIYAVSHYVGGASVGDEKWETAYQSNPSMYTRLNIALVRYMISDERIWFCVNFWDGLEHMGEYDYKVWVTCDTGSGGGFADERFCDGSQDFIMEVSTESGRTISKLYSASKGMGYNQPHLTDVELDSTLGVITFSCKLSRLGNPDEMDIIVAGGGWKAPEAYWDSTTPLTIKPVYASDEPVFTEITDDGEDECAFDIGKVRCAHNDKKLFFRIDLTNKLDNQTHDGIVRIMINSDLDLSTGLPPSPANAGGEDHMIEIDIGKDEVSGQVYELTNTTKPVPISYLYVDYEDSVLEISVNILDLESTNGIIFFATSQYPTLPGMDDSTEWNLTYSLTGVPIQEPCGVIAPHLVYIEGDGQVKLQWKAVCEEIQGYNIYRAITGGEYTRINEDIIEKEQTEFVDYGVANDCAYRYYIKAICKSGAEGLKSNIVSAKPRAKVTAPIIHITPSLVDMDEIIKPLGQHRTIQIKNDGPTPFTGDIVPQVDWLNAYPSNLSLNVGESINVKIEISRSLVAGNYTGCLILSGSGVSEMITLTARVLKSPLHTDYVNNLQIEPFTLAIRLSWNPPTYNHEELLEYRIIRTEIYMSREVDQPREFIVESNALEFMDSELDAESTFTYSVVPVYPSGEGIPRIVSASSTPLPVYMSMSIGDSEAIVNDEAVPLDVPPTIVQGRTMVPFRFIGEALNASIDYDAESRTAIFKRGRRIVKIPIGSSTASIDGEDVIIDPPATIVKDRTMVPLRFISEAFRAKVTWDSESRSVEIFYPEDYRPHGWSP